MTSSNARAMLNYLLKFFFFFIIDIISIKNTYESKKFTFTFDNLNRSRTAAALLSPVNFGGPITGQFYNPMLSLRWLIIINDLLHIHLIANIFKLHLYTIDYNIEIKMETNSKSNKTISSIKIVCSNRTTVNNLTPDGGWTIQQYNKRNLSSSSITTLQTQQIVKGHCAKS